MHITTNNKDKMRKRLYFYKTLHTGAAKHGSALDLSQAIYSIVPFFTYGIIPHLSILIP